MAENDGGRGRTQIVEETLGVTLPEDYREFLKKDGYLDEVDLSIYGLDETLDHDSPQCVIGATKNLRHANPLLLRNCIAIGLDKTLDCPIVLDTSNDSVAWFIDSDLRTIALSFGEWLNEQMTPLSQRIKMDGLMTKHQIAMIEPKNIPDTRPIESAEASYRREQLRATREQTETMVDEGKQLRSALNEEGKKNRESIDTTGTRVKEAVKTAGGEIVDAVDDASASSTKWSKRNIGVAIILFAVPVIWAAVTRCSVSHQPSSATKPPHNKSLKRKPQQATLPLNPAQLKKPVKKPSPVPQTQKPFPSVW